MLGVVAAGAPVHLVGHSYGGAAALRLALQQPAAIASLTLYEPSAFHVLEAGGPAAQAAHREIRRSPPPASDGLLSGDYAAAAERFVAYWGGGEAWSRMKPEARRAMAACCRRSCCISRAARGADAALGLRASAVPRADPARGPQPRAVPLRRGPPGADHPGRDPPHPAGMGSHGPAEQGRRARGHHRGIPADRGMRIERGARRAGGLSLAALAFPAPGASARGLFRGPAAPVLFRIDAVSTPSALFPLSVPRVSHATRRWFFQRGDDAPSFKSFQSFQFFKETRDDPRRNHHHHDPHHRRADDGQAPESAAGSAQRRRNPHAARDDQRRGREPEWPSSSSAPRTAGSAAPTAAPRSRPSPARAASTCTSRPPLPTATTPQCCAARMSARPPWSGCCMRSPPASRPGSATSPRCAA